jgi:hypothetical protein
MKVIRVTYITKAEYADHNQQNIKAVMADLQENKIPGLFYFASIGEDGKSFMHTAVYQNDEARKVLNERPLFKQFVSELKASGPESGPQQEIFDMVGSSMDIFR